MKTLAVCLALTVELLSREEFWLGHTYLTNHSDGFRQDNKNIRFKLKHRIIPFCDLSEALVWCVVASMMGEKKLNLSKHI